MRKRGFDLKHKMQNRNSKKNRKKKGYRRKLIHKLGAVELLKGRKDKQNK